MAPPHAVSFIEYAGGDRAFISPFCGFGGKKAVKKSLSAIEHFENASSDLCKRAIGIVLHFGTWRSQSVGFKSLRLMRQARLRLESVFMQSAVERQLGILGEAAGESFDRVSAVASRN